VKAQYRLKLRQTTGFPESVFSLTGLGDMVLPDFSTLCRRQKLLPIAVSDRLSSGERLNTAIPNSKKHDKVGYGTGMAGLLDGLEEETGRLADKRRESNGRKYRGADAVGTGTIIWSTATNG
jgi:hypothetical protein